MSDAYLGEIKLFSGNYAPENWKLCDGSLLSINQYQALFSLIATTYGGDGANTFGLPDLRGRVPVGQGQGTGLSQRSLGSNGGSETVTLVAAEMPVHSHVWPVSTADGTTNQPGSAVMLAKPAGTTNAYTLYRAPNEAGLTTTDGPDDMIAASGGGAGHNNIMSSMALTYIICVNGIFPQRAN
ncbi:MAG: tail fiber protein [Methylobacter sp.]